LLKGVGVGRLVDMNYVGEDLSQIHVNAMIKFPFDLTQEVAKDSELVNVEKELLADAFEQSLERVFEVEVVAKGQFYELSDEKLHCVVLCLEVGCVEARILRGPYLKCEILGLCSCFCLIQCPLHLCNKYLWHYGFYYLFNEKTPHQ
jgi:hypothetical protein